jgi:HEAT repeat protein
MEWEKRFARIKSLGAQGTDSALEELLTNTDEQNTSVRCALATALANYPENNNALSTLVEMLSDPETWVRIRAVQALAKFKETKAPDYIIQHLELEKNEKVRATMVKTIGLFNNEKFLPVLLTYLTDEDPRVRANTIEGLGYIKSPKVKALLQPFLKDPNSRIKANAARIIMNKEFSDNPAQDTLREMLFSEDQFERASAIYAIGDAALDKFLPVLIELISDKSFIVQRNLAAALKHFGKKAEELVLKRLSDKDANIRANCCKILATIGTSSSLNKLIPHLDDSDGEVRSLCERAVSNIEESDGGIN